MEYNDSFVTDKLRWEKVNKNWNELESRLGVNVTSQDLWIQEATSELLIALLNKIDKISRPTDSA